jgi:putative ubiquitin-RnfH superfamily antitoxin RatB of RatAB toxin-antitoxin module
VGDVERFELFNGGGKLLHSETGILVRCKHCRDFCLKAADRLEAKRIWVTHRKGLRHRKLEEASDYVRSLGDLIS